MDTRLYLFPETAMALRSLQDRQRWELFFTGDGVPSISMVNWQHHEDQLWSAELDLSPSCWHPGSWGYLGLVDSARLSAPGLIPGLCGLYDLTWSIRVWRWTISARLVSPVVSQQDGTGQWPQSYSQHLLRTGFDPFDFQKTKLPR